ncbi:hypothetical protein T439DRAFT_378295 [Meredithblackwellia eburnea MCA 4105]
MTSSHTDSTILNTTAILESVLLFAFNLVLSALGQGGSVALYLTSLYVPYLTLEACKSRNITQLIGTLFVFHPLVVVYSALSLNESVKKTIGWSESGMLMKDWTKASVVLTSLGLVIVVLAQLVYIVFGVEAYRAWEARIKTSSPQNEKLIKARKNYEIYKLLSKFSIFFIIDFGITTFLFAGGGIGGSADNGSREWSYIVFGIAVGVGLVLGIEWYAIKHQQSWMMCVQLVFNLAGLGGMLFNIVAWDMVTVDGDYVVYYPNEYQYARLPGVKFSNAVWWHYVLPVYVGRLVYACLSWHAFRRGFLKRDTEAARSQLASDVTEALAKNEATGEGGEEHELGKI